MKSILHFLWCSLIAQSVMAQEVRPIADICLPHYKVHRAETDDCRMRPNELSPFLIRVTILGKSLKDGFRFDWNPNQMNGHLKTVLFADNGSETPIPGGYRDQKCQDSKWLYFKGSGFRKSVLDNSRAEQFQNVWFRVRYWGSINNPDSMHFEYRNPDIKGSYVTIKRDTVCDQCLATDKIPPVITGCPTQIVELRMPAATTKMDGEVVMKRAGIKVTDNCRLANATNYPHSIAVTDGQIVDYQTIAYDEAGNRSDCRFKVKFLLPQNDTCSVRFRMEARQTPTCDGSHYVTTHATNYISLLGKRIADGIQIYRGPMTAGGSTTVLFGKNGSTIPPRGIHYRTCSGHWTYFTASGRSVSTRGNQNTELTNIHLRVKHFGNESNPDSLRIEFAENSGFPGGTLFNTSKKWTDCDKCRATDKTPPVIQHCPTQIVKYPVIDPLNIGETVAAKLANIKVSDNCEVENVSTYPHRVSNVKKGQIIDFHTVAYDDAGNKSVCQFKVQIVVPPCSEFPKPVIGYLPDVEVLAAAGQTCKAVTWQTPYLNNESSFNPVKFTSNYPSGHCFPIGVTRVFYTVKDSCGKTDTAGFFVKVRRFDVPDIQVEIFATQGAYFAGTSAQYTISVLNKSGVAFSNVKVKFPFHPNTINDGKAVPSIGTWAETCANGVKCYEWTIPTLGVNQVGQLMVPLQVLRVIGKFTLKAQLISSVPADADASNNSATWEMDSGNAAPRLSADNQQVTLDIKTLSPNPTDGALLMNLKSLVEKEVTFDFYNTVGSKVLSQTQQVQKGDNELFFDLTKLPKGVYFIQTSELDDRKAATKVVKY